MGALLLKRGVADGGTLLAVGFSRRLPVRERGVKKKALTMSLPDRFKSVETSGRRVSLFFSRKPVVS